MNGWAWLTAGLLVAVAWALAIVWRPWQQRRQRERWKQAFDEFRLHRERLEARFVELAANSGKPRGLRWIRCDFDDPVEFARDRASGDLAAFVAVTIGFEAIAGGGMEEVEAVSNLRAATAVFQYHDRAWRTDGRTVFNLSPVQAIAYYKQQIEPVAPELLRS